MTSKNENGKIRGKNGRNTLTKNYESTKSEVDTVATLILGEEEKNPNLQKQEIPDYTIVPNHLNNTLFHYIFVL